MILELLRQNQALASVWEQRQRNLFMYLTRKGSQGLKGPVLQKAEENRVRKAPNTPSDLRRHKRDKGDT